jgi:hypothetical protein
MSTITQIPPFVNIDGLHDAGAGSAPGADVREQGDEDDARVFAGCTPPALQAGALRSLREAEDDAATALALLRAGMAARAIDPAQTLWLVDIAPADGERAWQVLRTLAMQAPRAPHIRYLACCRDSAHAAALIAHPQLAPLLRQGRLVLEHSGEGLPPQAIRNPLLVLAHDGLSARAQGVYRSLDGVVQQAWRDPRGGIDWRPLRSREGAMRLLAAYRDAPADACFSLAHGAMDLLSRLLRASGGRLLLRASDVGLGDAARSRAHALWTPAQHAFDPHTPLPVNFDALARWHRANRGSAQQLRRSDDGRVLHIALHDAEDGRLRECLPEISALPHPDDHAQLLCALNALAAPTPEQCLALLHALHADPRALHALLPHLPGPDALSPAAAQRWRGALGDCLHALFVAQADGIATAEVVMALARDYGLSACDDNAAIVRTHGDQRLGGWG